ncbi:MAG: hypothetical protein H6883_01125 [Rhodobiaceae bacterium]|nr:hypothetical protein [Rhodobiaceae bacterium]MCC0054720.1 hypothetical protein [Rhodobiaceae bacterium]
MARLRDPAIVFACVVGGYLMINWRFAGPTSTTDEIGYLANAAFLAGYSVDGASSYHFGYSLFLVPAFRFFATNAGVWKAIIATNAILFALAFSLLLLILRRFSNNRMACLTATLVVAAYPSYVTIAGYPYSSAAAVPVFIAACGALLWAERRPYAAMATFGLLVGFFFWVHPTGIAIASAAAIVLVVMAAANTRLVFPALIAAALIVTMDAIYARALEPSMLAAMTPDGFSPRIHYPEGASVLSRLGSLELVAGVAMRVLGQFGYLIIASLGVMALGLVALQSKIEQRWRERGVWNDPRAHLLIFAIASLFGIVLITALFFADGKSNGVQHLIYGRYQEAVLPVLLALAVLAPASRQARRFWPLLILPLFILLYLMVGKVEGWIYVLNIAAFWPAVIHFNPHPEIWFAMGLVACLVAVFIPRPLHIAAMVAAFIACIPFQLRWHAGLINLTGTTYGMPALIERIAAPGTCVGTDPEITPDMRWRDRERIGLYSFHLHRFDYRRVNAEDRANECDGPYLSFREPVEMARYGLVPLAREIPSLMYVYVSRLDPRTSDDRSAGVLRADTGGGGEAVKGRIVATDLAAFSLVGKLSDGKLATRGKAGVLFYGPYVPMRAGRFSFVVRGQADDAAEAYVELASDGGEKSFARFPVSSGGDGVIARGQFDFDKPVDGLEVRLIVTAESIVSVEDCLIEIAY